MPPMTLQINNYLNKMIREDLEDSESDKELVNSRPLNGNSTNIPSILLSNIHDQQFYQTLTAMFLSLAREAGTSLDQLNSLASTLSKARSTSSAILPIKNQNQHDQQLGRESYGWTEKSCSIKEQVLLVKKIEKELQGARQKQFHLQALKKYMKLKEQQIAPSFGSIAPTKKDRFRQLVNARLSAKATQSSNCYDHNLVQILRNSFRNENQCYKTMNNFIYLKTLYGHSADQDIQSYSQCYNAILDRTEKLIITAGQEGLIKVWSRDVGLLITTLKGHTDYINKIETSKCNKYLLSSAGDGIRFYDMKTMTSLGGWKSESILDITSIYDGKKSIFLFGDNRNLYLLSENVMLARKNSNYSDNIEYLTTNDFTTFSFVSLLQQEGIIISISISSNEKYILLGFDTGNIIIIPWKQLKDLSSDPELGKRYDLPGFCCIRAHGDEVVEVKWSNNNSYFTTGSKDGRCCFWELKDENSRPSLLSTLSVSKNLNRRKKKTFSCSYICWNCTFTHFAAGFQQMVDEQETAERGQGQIIIYNVLERKTTCEFSKDISMKIGGVRAMDAHPHFPNILVICEAEGQIILFDIFLCVVVNVFEERGYHIMHSQFCLIPTQCRFMKDGLSFIVSSEYGSVSIYGYDIKKFYNLCPNEQFLITDFQKFTLDDHSMKALPIQMEYFDDINTYPSGTIRSIRGQEYRYPLTIDKPAYLQQIQNERQIQVNHMDNIEVTREFLDKIDYNLKQAEANEKIYVRTWDEIENKKQTILFYERQRQHLLVSQCWDKKIQQCSKVNHQILDISKPTEEVSQVSQRQTTRIRKLKRHSNRVSYTDDFEYHDSQEEDYREEIVQEQQDVQEESISQEESDSVPAVRKNRRRRKHYEFSQESERNMKPKKTVKQDIQQIIENEDFMDFIKPRKKIKLNSYLEQGDDSRKFSRLRKQDQASVEQQQVDFELDCFRCLCKKADWRCKNCPYNQKFCEECHLFRGKINKNIYTCLICIFLQNHKVQQYTGVCQDYYRAEKRADIFVPQIDDKVRFFFQGYEEFLCQNIKKLNNSIVEKNPLFRILPHTQNDDLINTPLSVVKNIEYVFPLQLDGLEQMNKRNQTRNETNHIIMLLELEIIPEKSVYELSEEQVTENQIFWIFYIPGYDFLLQDEIYAQMKKLDLSSLFQVNDLISFENEEAQIVDVNPFESRYPQSIWKMIKIRKTEGKRLRGNTKQIQKRANIWKLNQNYEISYSSLIQQKHSNRLQNQISKWVNDESYGYSLFVDYVDFQIYPSYRHSIQVGMCLNTIAKRLKNNYYNGYHSLQSDINLIWKNSEKFNGVSKITKDAIEMCQRLLELLKKQESQNGSRKGHQQTTVKKQNKKREEQIEQKSQSKKSHQEMKIAHRNNGQIQLRTRKQYYKEQSSEYIRPDDPSEQEGFKTQGRTRLLRSRPQNINLRQKDSTDEDHSKRITRSRTKN